MGLFQNHSFATKYSNVGISTRYLSKIRRSNKKDINPFKNPKLLEDNATPLTGPNVMSELKRGMLNHEYSADILNA